VPARRAWPASACGRRYGSVAVREPAHAASAYASWSFMLPASTLQFGSQESSQLRVTHDLCGHWAPVRRTTPGLVTRRGDATVAAGCRSNRR
jgi:hypothetical protein